MTARRASALMPPAKASATAKPRLRVWLRLLRATRYLENELRERLRQEFDTTLPRFDVLSALERADAGLTMTELSRALMVSNGNVTGIIERLVGDGLVAREVLADDRRATRVRLTRRGGAVFGEMAAAHEAWVDELLAQVSLDDADALIPRLDQVMATRRKGHS